MSIGSKNINLSRMAAQVVTNLAKVYPNDLDNAIEPLRENSVSDNHVIRMSAASALEQMYALPKYHNMEFWQMLSTLYSVEKKDNIRKIYQRALDS
ncbi:hypothetical protein LJB89_04715, partial [Tyzzerella sp. OttesenSCG-928-J15]|nr:hypothetical protein [Tyzzerella sp. OttesenSCG-928-J15]